MNTNYRIKKNVTSKQHRPKKKAGAKFRFFPENFRLSVFLALCFVAIFPIQNAPWKRQKKKTVKTKQTTTKTKKKSEYSEIRKLTEKSEINDSARLTGELVSKETISNLAYFSY